MGLIKKSEAHSCNCFYEKFSYSEHKKKIAKFSIKLNFRFTKQKGRRFCGIKCREGCNGVAKRFAVFFLLFGGG
jgi:hypothetical protein